MATTKATTWRWLTPAEREWAATALRDREGSVAEIAQALGCSKRTVWRIREQWALRRRGAARSPLRLALAEREQISRGLAAGKTARAIARELNRAPSTIAREINRCGGRDRYRALGAQRRFVTQVGFGGSRPLTASSRILPQRLALSWILPSRRPSRSGLLAPLPSAASCALIKIVLSGLFSL